MDSQDIFKNLFVLELANNHWGSLERGLKIIRDHAKIVRHNKVKAAIKLQFRDVDNFIHSEFRGNEDIRYIKKTEATKLSIEDFGKMIDEIKNQGCIPMATPFDEKSVELCEKFNLPMIKIASSDLNDWPLIERIAETGKPVIASTGGSSEKDIEDIYNFFKKRKIPLSLNHCVSLYPSEDSDLELSQIDYLKKKFPDIVIGLSTHEYHDWSSSIMMSYAKGARTWERHIDIDYSGVPVSKYCSTPEQVDTWFKAFNKAQEMCGTSSNDKRIPSHAEVNYLNALLRGIYAKEEIKAGTSITRDNFSKYFSLAIPLLKGQLSCREVINGLKITKSVKKGEPLMIEKVDGPYAETDSLRKLINSRGIDPTGNSNKETPQKNSALNKPVHGQA